MVICCTYICQHWVLEGHGVVIDVTTHIGASSPLHSCFWPPWTTGRPGRGSQPQVSPPSRSAGPSWCSLFSSSPSHAFPHHTLWSEDCLMPTGVLPPPGPRPWGSMSLKNGESWIMPEYSRCPNTAVSGELDYAQIWSCYHVGVPPNPPVQCRAWLC